MIENAWKFENTPHICSSSKYPQTLDFACWFSSKFCIFWFSWFCTFWFSNLLALWKTCLSDKWWASDDRQTFLTTFSRSSIILWLRSGWLPGCLVGGGLDGWLVGWLGEHLSRLDELIRQSGDHTIAICSVQCAAWNMNFKVCNVTKRVSRQCGTLHTVWVRNVELREELLGQMELGPD